MLNGSLEFKSFLYASRFMLKYTANDLFLLMRIACQFHDDEVQSLVFAS